MRSTPSKHILLIGTLFESVDIAAPLLKNGYFISNTPDIASALPVPSDTAPDLILLAAGLLNGVDLCHRLQTENDCPVIFVGSTNSLAEKKEAFAAGCTEYIGPPFSIDELLIRIKTQLNVSALATENRQLAAENGHLQQAAQRDIEQLHTIITNMPGILFILDKDGRFTLSKGRGLASLGLKTDQIVGLSAYELYKESPDIIQGIKDALSGKASHGTVFLRNFPFNIWYFPYRDVGEKILGIIGIIVDITESTRAKEKSKWQAAQLALIQKIGEKITAVLQLDQLLDTITTSIQEALNYHHVALFILEKDQLVLKSFADIHISDTVNYAQSIHDGLIGWTARNSTKRIANDVRIEAEYIPSPYAPIQPKSELCLPIIINNDMIGVLDIQSLKTDAFNDDDVAVMEAVTDQIAIAINQAYLHNALILELEEHHQTEITNRKLLQAIEQSPVTVIITDLDGNIEYANPQFSKTTGYSIEEIIGQNPRLLKSGYTPPEEYALLWETITHGHEWRGQFHNRKKNGELYWEAATISPIVDENGNITHYLSVKEEITAQKEMEDRLQQRNNELAFINRVSSAMVSFLKIDQILKVLLEELRTLWNVTAGMVWMIEEQSGDLVCRQITEAFQKTAVNWRLPADSSILGWVVQTGESVVVDNAQDDPRFQRLINQEAYPLRAQLTVPLKSRRGIIGAIQFVDKEVGRFTEADLSVVEALAATAVNAIENARLHEDVQAQLAQLKKTQAQLLQSEKLAIIGELVAGVAHELNNPLASVILYAQLMEARGVDAYLQHDLDKIVTQAHRASKVVRGLLDFARQRPSERKPTQINTVLQSTIDLLAYELRTYNIIVETEFAPEIPPLSADIHQLQQVFVNLINNALQAMSAEKDEGTLIIRTVYPAISAFNKEDSVLIVVQDDGPGIPEEHITRIFDPFFTTKTETGGTGLGLSVCHGIITDHQGLIWAENGAERGTIFFIELPIIKPKKSKEIPDDTIIARPVAETAVKERILVIDDEISVLTILTRILRRNGYSVDGVNSGTKALENLQKEKYDLIISDLRMPDMCGQELYHHLMAGNFGENSHFIFITGDAITPKLHAFLHETNAIVLEKPFEMNDFLHTVKQQFIQDET